MTCREIAKVIEQMAGEPGPDEGFRFGNPDIKASGVAVCWMATLEAISCAAEQGCNMIVCHEQLEVPYTFRRSQEADWLCWPVNRDRLEALARNNMVVYRAHGMLDRYCVLDDFGELLNLPEPTVREGFIRIYDVQPTPLALVVERAKQRTGLRHLRVTGALDNMVRRIGLAWGGLGLSLNIGFVARLIEYGVDCIIAGETDEYAQRFCQDAKVALVETGHAASEEPGLKHFARDLSQELPDVKVIFCPLSNAWQVV